MAFDLDDEELEATRELNGVGRMSEEKIITTIKEMLKTNENIFEETGNCLHFSKGTAEDIRALLELYSQEKEKNKKLEKDNRILEIMKNENEKEIGTLINKVNARGEVIDMMAEDISNSDIDEDICRQYATKEKRCAEGNNQEECVKCIREYYFKKARGE